MGLTLSLMTFSHADQLTSWGPGCSSISARVWWTATSGDSVRQKVMLIKHLSSGR